MSCRAAAIPSTQLAAEEEAEEDDQPQLQATEPVQGETTPVQGLSVIYWCLMHYTCSQFSLLSNNTCLAVQLPQLPQLSQRLRMAWSLQNAMLEPARQTHFHNQTKVIHAFLPCIPPLCVWP